MMQLPVELAPLLDLHSQGGSLLFIFDYDRTLAPLLEESGRSTLEKRTRSVLCSLASHERMAVGVIGNGKLKNLKENIRLHHVYYCGSGGLEFDLQGTPLYHPQAEYLFDKFEVLASGVEREIKDIHGAWIEKNLIGFTVRCRTETPEIMSRLRECTYRGLAAFRDEVRLNEEPHAIEVIPRTDWTKGHAIRTIVEASGNRNGKLLYAGEGVKDSEAFEIAKRQGGITISVGSKGTRDIDLLLPDAPCMMRLLEEVLVVLCRERDLTR
jgi:trehalose-phosphatase